MICPPPVLVAKLTSHIISWIEFHPTRLKIKYIAGHLSTLFSCKNGSQYAVSCKIPSINSFSNPSCKPSPPQYEHGILDVNGKRILHELKRFSWIHDKLWWESKSHKISQSLNKRESDFYKNLAFSLHSIFLITHPKHFFVSKQHNITSTQRLIATSKCNSQRFSPPPSLPLWQWLLQHLPLTTQPRPLMSQLVLWQLLPSFMTPCMSIEVSNYTLHPLFLLLIRVPPPRSPQLSSPLQQLRCSRHHSRRQRTTMLQRPKRTSTNPSLEQQNLIFQSLGWQELPILGVSYILPHPTRLAS